MADHEEDHQGPGPQPTGPPHRTRLSIPAADVSTIRWLGVQENVSASLRLLVREHIARHGYTDPTCAPVEQQPRRGRPPGSRTRRERRQVLRRTREESEAARLEEGSAPIGDIDFADAEQLAPEEMAPLHAQIIAGGHDDDHDHHGDQGTQPTGEDNR